LRKRQECFFIRSGACKGMRAGWTAGCGRGYMSNLNQKASWEARKKIICELVNDSIYVPMKEKELAAFMQVAKEEGIPVFAHCEDKKLMHGGVMNAGERAKELGMPGILNEVEDIIVARDIVLAGSIGVHLHLCHCSTAKSVWMVKQAKENGMPVTAEACPHHFTLSQEDITADDANFKMNPPLRSVKDVDAIREGLKNGAIDVIATDHAPHTAVEKGQSMKRAPFGVVGLETAAAVTYSELVLKDYLTPMQMAEKLSYNPAKVIGSDKGTLQEGSTADIVIFDPNQNYTIQAKEFAGKAKNTPFDNRKVTGKVITTIVSGEVVYSEE